MNHPTLSCVQIRCECGSGEDSLSDENQNMAEEKIEKWLFFRHQIQNSEWANT
jgi:hypothetical protein